MKPEKLDVFLDDCPFCGGEAHCFHGENRASGHGCSDDTAGVECTVCKARIAVIDYANDKVFERQLECAKKWNERKR